MTSPSVVSLKVSDVPSNRARVEMSDGVRGQHVRIVTSQTSNPEKLTKNTHWSITSNIWMAAIKILKMLWLICIGDIYIVAILSTQSSDWTMA